MIITCTMQHVIHAYCIWPLVKHGIKEFWCRMSEALFNSQEESYCSDNELCSHDIEMAQVSDESYIF